MNETQQTLDLYDKLMGLWTNARNSMAAVRACTPAEVRGDNGLVLMWDKHPTGWRILVREADLIIKPIEECRMQVRIEMASLASKLFEELKHKHACTLLDIESAIEKLSAIK